MSYPPKTTLMWGNGQFPSTQWTFLIHRANQNEVKAHLYQLYFRPLYCLLQRKGFSQADAREYTQDFLTEILFGREFFAKADKDRGKFRSLLVKSFINHVNGILRKKRDRTYDPTASVLHEIPDTVPDDPLDAFNYAWATEILHRALNDVKDRCAQEDLKTHWHLFRQRVLDPILENRQPPSLPELCERYHVKSPSKVSNMIVTVKRRLQTALIQHIRSYTDSDQDCNEELEDFMACFRKMCATPDCDAAGKSTECSLDDL